jgi:ubiquitin carboxyl-terminal hydrolase 1
MNPRPETFERYGRHHTQPSTPTSLAVYAVISGLLIHYLLLHAGFVSQSLTQLTWNVLVRAMPARLLFKLDPAGSGNVEQRDMASKVGLYAAKSEVMGRILGMRPNNLLGSLKRARAMSGLGNAFSLTRGEAPPGLGNWDNSCYQNSVIQGFAALPALSTFLEHNIGVLGKMEGFETQKALAGVIESLNDPGNYGRRFWTPDDLKSMSSWQQQDAQEYFSKVVEQIDKEIGKALKGRTDDLGLKEGNLPTIEEHASSTSKLVGKAASLRSLIDARNSYRNPLEGLLAQRVGCMRCGFSEGLALIPFNCLTVPLGNAWKQDVRDCLDEYTALEPIEGVECGMCTLLQVRDNLKQILHRIANEPNLEEDGQPQASNALKVPVEQRLKVVETALEEKDFSENTLLKKCHIPSRNRVSTTKSRQAVIARAPKSLVIHVNRSQFDEITGAQTKNRAVVQFPKTLDLSEWCLGTKQVGQSGSLDETWEMDPSKSLLNLNDPNAQSASPVYELRAAIQHYGRHENGHYICYRKYPTQSQESAVTDEIELEEKVPKEQWWRLSDDDVSISSEEEVLNQGGVFMLFYEVVEEPECPEKVVPVPDPTVDIVMSEVATADDTAASEIPHPVAPLDEIPPRSDTPQTVIDLRIDQPVPSAIPEITTTTTSTQAERELEQERLDDSPDTPTSSNSSSSTPAREESPAPAPLSPLQQRTFTPIMRTSSIPDKTGSHHAHGRNVPSMVTPV